MDIVELLKKNADFFPIFLISLEDNRILIPIYLFNSIFLQCIIAAEIDPISCLQG